MKIEPDSFKYNDLLVNYNSVFRHLSSQELDLLPFDTKPEVHKKGTILYSEGSRISGFYWVCKGIIKVYKSGIEGKEQIIRFAKPGDIIGFRSVLSKELACTSAKVIQDTELFYIPADLLTYFVKHNGDFSLDILQLTCKELEESNSYIKDIAQKTVRERLAEILIHLKNNFAMDENNILQINLTREELANIVGTATESVIRLLSEFKSEGLIELIGRKIKLVEIKKLERIANI